MYFVSFRQKSTSAQLFTRTFHHHLNVNPPFSRLKRLNTQTKALTLNRNLKIRLNPFDMGSRVSRVKISRDREEPRYYPSRPNGCRLEKGGRSRQTRYLAQQEERRARELEMRVRGERAERVRNINAARRREWDAYRNHRVRGEGGMCYF